MTPSYAAPEQVQGEAITTATDVYALGVVLCELLTGALPYDVRGRPMVEAVQVIADDTPERLSMLVDTDSLGSESTEAVLTACDMSAEALKTRLQGDLEVMVRKALRKEPERRYTSAAEFGQDINRHLNGLPVEARPATTGYRLRRFIARNRPAVMGASAAVVALILGLGVAIWQGQVAAAERDRAQQQAERAEAVQTFLVDMIGRAAPAVTGGEELTVREVLGEADAELATPTLQEQPEVGMEVRQTLGRMYLLLDRFEEGVAQTQEAFEISQNEYGDDHPETLSAAANYGHALFQNNQLSEADSLFSSLLPVLDSENIPTDLRFRMKSRYGEVLAEKSESDRAESMLKTALDGYERARQRDTLEMAGTLSALGTLYRQENRLDEAEEMYRYALSISEAREHPEQRRVEPTVLNNLALVYRDQENYTRAVEMYRRSLDLSISLYGRETSVSARVMYNLASTLRSKSEYLRAQEGENASALQEAEAALNEADEKSRASLALHRELFGDTHPQIGSALFVRVDVLRSQERLEEGISLAEEALAIYEQAFGSSHPVTAIVYGILGEMHHDMGASSVALAYAQEALSQFKSIYGEDAPHNRVAYAQSHLGAVHTELGNYEQAETLLSEAADAQEVLNDQENLSITHSRLVDLYQAWGRPEAADQFDGADQQADT